MTGYSQAPKEERLAALKKLVPEAFCEGKIDREKLLAALGEDVSFTNERYVLNWAGKSEAFRVLQAPSSATLVPARDESVDFDGTQNIFIEGENLAVLKALQRSYFGKVKMIYIDPPYNTGNDSFIYPDKFSETKEEYQRRVGDKDEAGYMLREGRFAKNTKENGQYHSNWLSMMMPRLYLAKNLLRDDGVIFVSIDENEVHNLRLLMNEIFGEENFVGMISWTKKTKPVNSGDAKFRLQPRLEYVLVYGKQLLTANTYKFLLKKKEERKYPLVSSEGMSYRLKDIEDSDYGQKERETMKYPILGILPEEGKRWKIGKEEAGRLIKNNRISVIGGKVKVVVYKGEEEPVVYNPFWSYFNKNFGTAESGKKELVDLLGHIGFDTVKPVSLISEFLSHLDEVDIVLDFFAGSGTTAHAVMELNGVDRGKRKFICVQLPEPCKEKSEAFKAGYKTIADIAKERIRRAGTKIRESAEAKRAAKSEQLNLSGTPESAEMPDTGFKVFKLAESNFKQWRATTASSLEEIEQQMLAFVDPVEPGARVENMIYELLLKNGKDLNGKIVRGNGFYDVDGGELILILESVSEEIVDAVLSRSPQKVIALDRLFRGNDQLKTNTALQFRDRNIEFLTI